MQNRRPLAIDLFAGAGGLSLGFEQAGFDIVAAVESDPIHAAVHRFNFPNTPVICSDIRNLTGQQLLRAARAGMASHGRPSKKRQPIDVIVGGPPCQGFSFMGARDVDDPRNSLIFEFARIVAELRPKYFVMENVAGIKSGEHSDLLKAFMGLMSTAGYVVSEPSVLNAADFGVPQSRQRIFVIGRRRGQRLPQALQESKRINVAFKPQKRITVSDAIADLPSLAATVRNMQTKHLKLDVDQLLVMKERASRYARTMRGWARDAKDLSYPRKWDRTFLFSIQLTTHLPAVKARFARTSPGETEPISRFHRLDLNGVSNTLRAGTGVDRGSFTSARPIHPTEPRVITVREAARIHSFPDWFRFHETRWRGFQEVGNSVPPLLARAVARQLVQALGLRVTRPRAQVARTEETLLKMTPTTARQFFSKEQWQKSMAQTQAGSVKSSVLAS